MLEKILQKYGLNTPDVIIEPFGSGLINHTWKITANDQLYILQAINTGVFKSPPAIAANLVKLRNYLREVAPDYIFPAPLPALNGEYLIVDNNTYYRLLPFVKGSHTVNVVTDSAQAYEAAKQFGKFSRLLNGFDPGELKHTLPDFHNLNLRVAQFKRALQTAGEEKLNSAAAGIEAVEKHIAIADQYAELVQRDQLPLRVIHHDTKINNVLFDNDSQGLCVIDLDTIMPGYFISDVGDMMRTYLSPVNEEEQDLTKLEVREDYIKAIYNGYMGQMGDVLTPVEKDLFFYSGKFMIYMQALRFLTDHLNGDIYYPTTYAGHNLARAQNQLTLLNNYLAAEDTFRQYTQDILTS